MSKILVSYFSASGVTRRVAENVAKLVDGDLFEIEPKEKYSDADLDWTNKSSRSSIEMSDKSFRPEVLNKVSNMDLYDKVIIGFPVWWYTAPTIINTFIEENDLKGKDVYIFVTSGGSGSLACFNDLSKTYPNINFVNHVRFTGSEDVEDILNFIR